MRYLMSGWLMLMPVWALAQDRSPDAMGFFDKSAIFGLHAFMLEAELDGNPATREWAGWDIAGDHAGYWRTARVQPDTGRICVSPYQERFSPNGWIPQDKDVYYVNLVIVQGRSMVQIQSSRWYKTVALPMPECRP